MGLPLIWSILRSRIAGSYGNSVFDILRNCQTVSKVATPIYIPISAIWGFQFLCSLAKSVTVWLQQFWWLWFVSHCGFDLYLPDTMILRVFSCTVWTFIQLLCRNVYSNPLPIFKNKFIIFLLLSCKFSLYSLDTVPSLYVWLQNFLPFCGLSFYFLNSELWSTKVLSFKKQLR